MTNTEALAQVADEYGFRPDPGFSGELTRWEGSLAGVLILDGDVAMFQLYESCGVGDDLDMVASMELNPEDPARSLRSLIAMWAG
ncbi:MAG: hypothetical protein WC054_00025 [Candidatus Nanopelagicales bacterium]